MNTRTPPPTPVRVGFIALVDCAILAVAAEKGFARRENIDLQLEREVSWANIRDKVNLGFLDCAHMLAGMPIAASLGLGQDQAQTIAPMGLGLNGNAITLSTALFDALEHDRGDLDLTTPAGAGQALKRVIERRRADGAEPLRFAMVFPFSCHNYELRYWMAACGIDPEVDVRMVVIPPPFMVESLRMGHVDGFCVGEPWNSLAVEQDVGRIVLASAQIWPRAPEKVLGVRADWAASHPETLSALLRGLRHAAAWAGAAAHHGELADILSRERYLNIPAPLIMRALEGRLVLKKGAEPVTIDDFLVLNRDDACRPRREHALWLYSQMVRWRQGAFSAAAIKAVHRIFREDLYDQTGDSGIADPSPVGEGALMPFDGAPFTPDDIAAYLARFSIGAPAP
ncbi:CmpA/NrtA family ABC transporter substrate-binding protein [Varunaivibrio sulfuroxidans]|uniref:NitT/TauT family transport system ATP-binding protein n=1 Tax=Varunaivibrio sulfuroxidans TaxID=1773489 RepID=A0A4R3JA95_9PROT|nr:CmpA/NrtA family ABC transporter substrate-binding protein [Varunaivibrio sulfuroxidans]TCS62532.1 NitT/TauT family transport system ATP-binding protein [Varunaivibrio sulfuroxidans]WES30797.1 CmpA/NrtA family ABC transporter substrate-binding protein [Varunaivibrio sulfuroxidans]